jgi:hypothetical protein
MQQVEEGQRKHLESKLIVIGCGNEKENQTFKEKLVSQWIEAEGCNKNFRKEK